MSRRETGIVRNEKCSENNSVKHLDPGEEREGIREAEQKESSTSSS